MSFDNKLKDYFAEVNIKLSGKPAEHLIHIYADYVEIVSLFSNQNYISTSDILDRFRDEGIITQKKNDNEQAGENDKNEQWINTIFQILNEREYLYTTDYPFEILGNNKIKLKSQAHLTDKNRLYIFLLLASSLNVFGLFESELTSEFELVCFHALAKYLPSHATVKSFGKNTEYTGTATEKITKLATDLKVTIDDDFLNKISAKGNQERGLDIIGWIPFSDNISNQFSLFCQCACGKEWYKKLTETRRYERYYKFYCNKPNHAMFIPYSLINFQDSDFYQADELATDTLLFERKRILNYIDDVTFFNTLNSKLLVDNCIGFEEDIV
jgi:hypothetical protein